MSHITCLHHYLDTTHNWNTRELKTIITRNPSSINRVKSYWVTPLIKVLESEKCTVEIIKLLLDHGADINSKKCSSLMVALDHCADDKVIAMLLDNGAKVDVHKSFSSPLCLALRRKASKNVCQLLLDAGCSVDACKIHASLMHCFCSSRHRGINEDVLKFIFEVGAKVSKLDAKGQSPMCRALRCGAGPNDIKLLMRVGLSLSACRKHPSTLRCLVGDPVYRQKLLEGDVVKSLLNAGVGFDVVENDRTLLHEILHNVKYENEAIRLLLDVPGVDLNGGYQYGKTLLHCAVWNPFCQLSVLKFLLDKGADVGKLDVGGRTALDVAIVCNKPFKVIHFLLKKGSPINAQDPSTSRSLQIAFESRIYDKVMTLLIAGARIGCSLYFFQKTLSDSIRRKFKFYLSNRKIYLDYISEVIDCIKCLVKCYILEGYKFHIKNLTYDSIICDKLRDFSSNCKLELSQMDSENIGYSRTLHQFISRKYPPRTITADYCMSEGKDFDFNRLLEILSRNAFPLYFDIISANIGTETMEKKLQEVPVYTVIDCPDTPTDKKVTLNSDVVRKIASLLSDADMLKLILAFDKPKNNAGSKRGIEE